ncbi:S8 family serine peptidase [Methylopila sp. M107]|uniref:S8 family serine peptidase n=1 Tax=Methylopila sp. M107 TaxID=1101190 RepID=UPI00039A9BC0|nr:S8 family serine peptidase [Methylopila sp. M107]
MSSSVGPKSRSLFSRRLRVAFVAPLGVVLAMASVEAQAQYATRGNGEGGGKVTRWRGHGGGGGGGRAVGAGIVGGLIGLGAGLAIGEAQANRRRVREETVIEEYEVAPARRPTKVRRAPVEVVEDDGYGEPRPPRRAKPRRPSVDVVDIDAPEDARPTRKRPAAQPKPKVAKVAPVRPKDTAEPKPAPVTESARAAPPAAPPPVAPVVAPPGPQPTPALVASNGPDEVPGEVIIEVGPNLTAADVDALAARQRLERIESYKFELTNTTVFRWRIPDGRNIDQVVDALRADPNVLSAQPNHIFELSEALPADLASTQYAVAKMRLDEAHGAATGKGVGIAVIDSAIDPSHPALKGAVVESFDPIGGRVTPHPHGTGVASLAAGRGELASPAPNAEIYAVRAFAPEQKARPGAQGTTMLILRGLDWAASRNVRVVNMSFAGPRDAKIAEAIAAGSAKGIIYVAAAGNAGPASPPLFPAADPNVIAVTATDAEDRLLPVANRGPHLSIAAPGVDVLVAAPGGGVGFLSGTSMASAGVSGLIALMVEAQPGLPAWRARAALTSSARDLGEPGPDPEFGAGSADAMGALQALGVETQIPVAERAPAPVTVSSTRSASAQPASVSDSDVPPDAEAP